MAKKDDQDTQAQNVPDTTASVVSEAPGVATVYRLGPNPTQPIHVAGVHFAPEEVELDGKKVIVGVGQTNDETLLKEWSEHPRYKII